MKARVMVGIVGLALSVGIVRAEEHPEMTAAQHDLESAKAHLKAGAHDFGGHRLQAIADVDRALGQIKQALAFEAQNEKKSKGK